MGGPGPRRFQGKVALVTGAAGGIGGAVATALSAEGAQLALWDATTSYPRELLERLACTETLFAALDVADGEAVDSAMAEVRRRFGQIDVLVHAAGVMSVSDIDTCSAEEWEVTIRVNLGGTFAVCKAALREMRSVRSGRIVLVSSAAARSAGSITGIAYAASKAGMLAIAKQLAFREARHGIRVNAVAPGFVDTDMPHGNFPEADIERAVASFPVPRMASAREIAEAILFLASDAADYINGDTLFVTGGSFIA